MKCKSQLVLSVAFLFCITGCVTTTQPMPVLNGMIYDFDNEPVSGVKIALKDGKTFTSDVYGHFRIEDLKNTETYTITLSKNGYETHTTDFEYIDAAQILYVKMYSAEQLLAAAENCLHQKEYTDAASYLNRASNSDASSVAVGYLSAITEMFLQNYDQAVSILEQLLSAGYTESYIYLLLADIYQYKLTDSENAKKYLRLFLTVSYDPAAAERLSALE